MLEIVDDPGFGEPEDYSLPLTYCRRKTTQPAKLTIVSSR